MTTATEYRKYAAECLESAKETKSESERDAYLEMATAWLRAAALADPISVPNAKTPTVSEQTASDHGAPRGEVGETRHA